MIQDNFLGSMLAATRLQRIISSSNRDKTAAYPIDEYFEDMRNGLFSELKTRKPIDNYRRNIQKAFVERLCNMVNPPPSTGMLGGFTIILGPVVDTRKNDILSVVKATLRIIRDDITRSMPGYPDRMSVYHLQDMQERIQKALKVD
jgi:hypothetical protein